MIHLSAKQWSEARKDFKPGGRLPRNGTAIAVMPDSAGGAYILPCCGEAETDEDTVMKPRYDPATRTVSFAPHSLRGETAAKKKDRKRRRRRQCSIAISTASPTQFKCLSIGCRGKCHLEAKEFRTQNDQSIYLIYCACGN